MEIIYYLETTVNFTPPTFSLTTLAWGFQLGVGGEKMKDPLTQASNGPTLLPAKQEPFEPHHPKNYKYNLPQLDWWTQSVGLA